MTKNLNDALTKFKPHCLQTECKRRAELARLVPLWPRDLDDLSRTGRQRIIRLLERALREERQRGRSGNWAYDLNRHASLSRTLKNEVAALRAFEMHQHIQNANGPRNLEPLKT